MRVIITGVAGFIGSHIAERLLSVGYSVLGVDNFDTFYDRTLKDFNLAKVKDTGKRFTFYEVDIRECQSAAALIKQTKPDLIIHCAARAGVRPSVKEPLLYANINIIGTQNLLEAARLYSPRTRFIVLSSSSVYGIQKRTPFVETMRTNPLSPYGASKYAMEVICKQYTIFYDIQTSIVRPFSIYGPRGRIDMAPFLVIRAAERGEAFTQFGTDEDNKRDWTYIDDFVHGIFCLVDRKPKKEFDIYNFGNSTPVGIDAFIGTHQRLLRKYLHRDLEITHRERSREELPITYANIAKARKIGYDPRIPFAEGLEKMYRYYAANRSLYTPLWKQ